MSTNDRAAPVSYIAGGSRALTVQPSWMSSHGTYSSLRSPPKNVPQPPTPNNMAFARTRQCQVQMCLLDKFVFFFFLIVYLKFQNAAKEGNIGLVRQLFFQNHRGVNVHHADRVLRQFVCGLCT
jgi:hypothetical protein